MMSVVRPILGRAIQDRPLTATSACLTAAFLMVLMLAGCAALPDDEATWALEDLAAGARKSRLKERTPDPSRKPVAYAIEGRDYQADLYLPGEPPVAGIVLVAGVAERGKDDPRVVALATTLARTRFLVLVPDLPNLRALRVRPGDAQSVADAFSQLLSRRELHSGSRIGIGAFSYAVGPAVLAALDPAIRERVDFVLGVGGYYDLHQVINFFTTGFFRKEGQWHYLEPSRYGKWAFVLSNLERLPDPRDRSAFRVMAERRLCDPHARIDDLSLGLTSEARALLGLLENRDRARTPALIDALPAAIRADIEALNLANRDLSGLQAELILLHGTDDTIIPYTESMSLAAAVQPGQAELFLIDGLAHVDAKPLGLDRHAMWRALHALFTQRSNPGEERE